MSGEKKILIVEDDSVLSWVLIKKFKKEGFDVLRAKNGEEGLDVALKEHPDLILLDIIMPKMDGITVLKKLRVHQWGSSVPVILLTNLSSVAVDQEVQDDVSEYLVKADWDIGEVVKKVRAELSI
jgi:DNA-binding response OmpR family regulator